jgi:hypothetical protein
MAAAIATLAIAAPVGAAGKRNPCAAPGSGHLLCPNLRIGRPSDLYVEAAGDGRMLLRATSDVKSRGRGPIELRARRNGRRSMRVNQRIYRAGGGHVTVRTRATLHFTDVGDAFGGYFWKVHRLADFELWSVGRHHRLWHRVRVGPKTNYCLRDLERTRPGRRSPRGPHYPGCKQSAQARRVTLGTSVGWSDVYPADYDRQWIDVAGLHGCFAFVMKVDPRNLFFESNERDNVARRLVHLPYRGRPGC